MTTPNDIDVLIHCHCSPKPHPRINAPAVSDTIQRFVCDGIVKCIGSDQYRTTEKGDAWLTMILRVPYPTHVWVDESGRAVHGRQMSEGFDL